MGCENIDHLVILMMENRSFDHYLGSLSLPHEGRGDVEGLPNPLPFLPDINGNPVQVYDLGALKQFSGYGDPPHGPQPQTAGFDGGAMDGYLRSYQASFPGQTAAIGYYGRDTLPVLYALADNFTVCDHWFSSMLSSTWPNRKYMMSGCRDSDDDTQTIPGLVGFQTTPFLDQVAKAGIDWKCYFCDLPFLAFWYKFTACNLDHFHLIDQFVTDCQQGNLPPISIIDPPFQLADDHPSYDVRLGQKFVGLVVDALTHSQSWDDTMLVLTYDENGAFYDHVTPPPSFEAQAGRPEPHSPNCTLDSRLGPRVPTVLISPYTGRAVSKTVYDHTSIIKSVNTKWNVQFPAETFGNRWDLAPDIWGACTNDPLGAGTYTQSLQDVQNDEAAPLKGLSWESGVHDIITGSPGGVDNLLSRIFLLPILKTLDKRATLFDTLTKFEQQTVRLKRVSQRDPAVDRRPDKFK